MTDLHAELGSLSDIADGDQRSAAVASIANDVASYFKALRREKVPLALAQELTLQAANYLWQGCACDD